ncbi:VOC family protein [Exiguobacterium undae]|uniref:VOC family protein n=1 Tax=Exiguobacterium undae TaxID=169177 RepID=UPI00047D109D|nr:VOC family protein [Exiguobacterium undae]
MPITPYLVFNGNTREAIHYYAKVFGQDIPEIMEFGPGNDPDGQPFTTDVQSLVLHSQLIIHDTRVMFSDAMPHDPVAIGQNVTLALHLPDIQVIHETFDKLAQDGNVIMPIQKTFWSEAYGIVEDPFGVQWQLNHEVSEVTA